MSKITAVPSSPSGNATSIGWIGWPRAFARLSMTATSLFPLWSRSAAAAPVHRCHRCTTCCGRGFISHLSAGTRCSSRFHPCRAMPSARPTTKAGRESPGMDGLPPVRGTESEDLEGSMLGGRRQERREQRREERRGDSGTTHYRMRQKLFSIGDDYWIEDERGDRVFKVDGKALRLRKTLILEDAHGGELLKIQERMLRVRDTMEIEDADGRSVATVKKAMVTPLRERWSVKVTDGPDLRVHGNIVDHEYAIEDAGTTAAEVSKKWFRVADTYGVEVAPGQDPVLLLAITAVLDTMAHKAR